GARARAVARAVVGGGNARRGVRRQLAVAEPERGRQRHILRLIKVPVTAGRCERMMRVGERALHEERRRAPLLRMGFEIRNGALDHVARRIERLGQSRAPSLREGIIWWLLVVLYAQRGR